jgi:predicted anti-sigma-YlaC factor YlaD
MNCRIFHDHLQRRLDGGEVDVPAALGHLRECRECAGLHGAAEKLAEGLRLLAPPVPPADLADRIALRVTRTRWFRPRARGRRRAVVPLAVAACLLIAIGLRLYLGRGPEAKPTPSAPREPNFARNQEQPATAEGLRDSVDQARQAVVALTSRATDEAVDQARRLLSDVRPPAVPRPEEVLQPPARTLRQAGAGVTSGLAPVTASARRAVDLFLRDLPPMALGANRGS